MNFTDFRKNTSFGKFLYSFLLNRLGDSVDVLTMSWLIYLLSGSAAVSALAMGINYIPSIVIQPLAGAWVERMHKKKVLILMDLGRFLLVMLILALYLGKVLAPYMLLCITFAVSTLEAFRSPATNGVLPRLLKEEEYEYGTSMLQGGGRIMELAGTGLAGVLIAWLGIYGALLVDASCFLIAALLILPLGLQEELQSQQAESYGKTLKEGISFLRDSRRLLLLVLLCGLLNAMLTPMQALQSALVKDIYQKGGETLSFMGATLSGGMLLGAFLYPFLAKRVAIDKALLLCGILNGGFYLVLAGCALISQNIFFYPVLGFSSLVFGVSIGFLNTALAVMIMKAIPIHYMSRETGLANALCLAAVPATSFLVSAAARLVKVPALLTASGILFLLIMAVLKVSGKLNELLPDDSKAGRNEEKWN